MSRIYRLWIVATFCIAVGSSTVRAQGLSVSGRIVDQQNTSVTGATIELTSPGQPARTARSAADGTFTFAGVVPAIHTVRVEAAGFAQSTQTVTVGSSSVTLTVTLQIAGLVEDLTVQGEVLGSGTTGKSAQPARNLPLTIQGIPGQIVSDQGGDDLVAALQNTSGTFAFTNYGVYEYYTFRGFFNSAQLVDGIRNEGPNRINSTLTGVERVDVLKGPASALYGPGAVGGTVNVIRKQPSAISSYDVMGAFGNWDTARGDFGAAGRLGSDAALYRVDLGGETSDGYRHDSPKRFTFTPSLSWRLGDGSQLNAYYSFSRVQFGGDAGLPLVDTSLGIPTDQNVLDVPHDRNYRTPYDDATDVDNNVQIVYAKQLTNALGFRNAFSYRHLNELYFLAEEVDFIAPSTIDRYYLYFDHHRRPVANLAELTARVNRGIQQELLFGWDFERYYNYTTLPAEDFFQAESIDAFNPVETQGPSDLTITRQNVSTSYTNGLYVQDHLTLGPKTKLLLGGRYDHYTNATHRDTLTAPSPVEGPITTSETNAWTGRVGLVYQPTPNEDVYGSWANSFTPVTSVRRDGSSLDPQTGSQWEIGQRTRLVHDRMQFTAVGFHILRQNVPFGRPGGDIVQAGEIRSQGFELDLETSLAANWRVNVGYGYTNSEFLDYEESPGVNRRGNTTQFAPRNTLNVWTGYDWRNGFGVNVGARYFGSVFADSGNEFEVDGYGLLNLAVRYRRGPLEFALNVNNVTDTTYYRPHLDYLQVYPGQPANLLATVRARFH